MIADRLEELARQLYLEGRCTRAEYARQVGRIRRIELARRGLTAFVVVASVLLIIGGLFA